MTDTTPIATDAMLKESAQPRSFLRLFLYGVLLLLSAGLMFIVAGLIFGLVVGEEFSPYQWKRRTFTYYEVPLLRIQISPVFHQYDTHSLEKHIRSAKFFPKAKKGQRGWDVARFWRGGGDPSTTSIRGDASILCEYLDAESDEKLRWLEWSKANPQMAALLWPEVVELARTGLYREVPDLMSLAVNFQKPANFQRQLTRAVVLAYRRTAQEHFALGEVDQAIELYTQALNRDPADVDSLKGRADAYTKQGKSGLAKADSEAIP